MITKFKRSDDVEFECEVGSESFKLMEKTGAFERVFSAEELEAQAAAEAAAEETDQEPAAKPLYRMNKLELLAEAEQRGLSLVPDEVNRAQIIGAIAEHDAKAAESQESDDSKTPPTE